MAVDFTLWMRRRGKDRVLLVELDHAVESGGALATATFYFSCGKYATQPGDTPASTPYIDCVDSAGMSQQIDISSRRASSSFKELVLSNKNGLLDDVRKAVVDGYECRFYSGDASWARADFQQIGSATAELIFSNCDELRVRLRDKRLLIDREIKGSVMGGAGPNATKSLPILIGFAENVDLSGLLYDATTFEYSVLSNYSATPGLTLGVADVREAGLSLRRAVEIWTSVNTTVNIATDVVNHPGHTLNVDDVVWFTILATTNPVFPLNSAVRPFTYAGVGEQMWVTSINAPNPGDVTFSLTKGGANINWTVATWNPDFAGASLQMIPQRWFDSTATNGRIRLSAKASGRITADPLNYISRAGFPAVDPDHPFATAGRIIQIYGGTAINTGSTVGIGTFTDADDALDAKVGVPLMSLWLPERANLFNVLDAWFAAIFGWYGQSETGRVIAGVLDVSGIATATPDFTLSEGEIFDGIEVENLPVSISQAKVQYEVNHTVQADGLSEAAALTDALRTKYSTAFGKVQESTAPAGTTYAANKPLYHRTMTPEPARTIDMRDSFPDGLTGNPLGAYADEIVADAAPHLCLLRCLVGLDKWSWRPGKIVQVTYPRYDFDNGRNAKIVGLAPDWIGGSIELTLLFQDIPTP